MGHQVNDDVDAERIGNAFGISAEIEFILSLPFPSVADVAVVDGQDHHPLLVIENRANVHFLGAFAAENSLEFGPRIVGIVLLVPKLNGRDLQAVHWSSKIVNAIKYGML